MLRGTGLLFAMAWMIGCFAGAPRAAAAPLHLGYSDWPGWVAWQIAIDKGWLTQAGVDVKFEWFDYSASMEAFAAGKLDGDLVTNGDALVMGAGGARNVTVLVTDFSNGNDMIVARPGIRSLKDLKGKKIGVEVGLVEHLLLMDGLKKSSMTQDDVALVNAKTNETPQVLASGQVDAIGAWQPNASLAIRALPGAHPVYTSAQSPGLIYDVLAVNPATLAVHRADYVRLIKVWDHVVSYINDPSTQDDAVQIMATRVGLSATQYKQLLAGTHLINVAEAKKVLVKGEGLNSLYGSSQNADEFNVRNAVYKQPQRIDGYIEPSLTLTQP
jgi:NitT/TauT family transport system substrate-binding protein